MVKEAQHHPPRRGQAPRDRGHPPGQTLRVLRKASASPATPSVPGEARHRVAGGRPPDQYCGPWRSWPKASEQPEPPRPGYLVLLLLVPALDAGLLEKLAVLLLGHPLAALLDDGAHGTTFGHTRRDGNRHASPPARHQGAGHSPGKDYRRPSLATDSSPTEAQRTHPAHSPQPAAWVWGSAPPGISSAATAQVPEGHRAALAASSPRLPLAASRIRHEGILQILIHGLLRYAKGTPHPDRLKLAGVDQTVDRHL